MTNLANSDGSDHDRHMPTDVELTLGTWLTTADQDFATAWKSVSLDWH
jgi:hypothetical protein